MDRLACGLAAALVVLALPAAARADDATAIPSAHVVVTVEPNGVLDVLEQVTIDAPKAYAAAQEVSMNAGELFAQPSVVVDERRFHAGATASHDAFVVSRGRRGVRITWQQPQGRSTVRLGYRLALLGIAYDDVVDVDVPLWERDWPGRVALFTGVFRLPRRSLGHVRAWIEGSYAGGMLSTSQQEVRVRVRGVPAKRSVRLRVVFPRTVLTGTEGVVVRHGNGLQAILRAVRAHPRHSTWWIWVVAGAALVLLSAVALRRGRSRPPAPR